MKALFTHKSIRAVFLWYREACPQEQGHLGELDPGREGFPACSCCLLSVPRMCTGLWEPPLEMVLTWADTLHSDMLIPRFNLCLMLLWSQLKSLYLFDLWFFFFFLTLTEKECFMSWKFNHFMFVVLIGVFVKWMSNLFMHALLWYNNLYHLCLINAIYFVLLMLSLCFSHDHI